MSSFLGVVPRLGSFQAVAAAGVPAYVLQRGMVSLDEAVRMLRRQLGCVAVFLCGALLYY